MYPPIDTAERKATASVSETSVGITRRRPPGGEGLVAADQGPQDAGRRAHGADSGKVARASLTVALSSGWDSLATSGAALMR